MDFLPGHPEINPSNAYAGHDDVAVFRGAYGKGINCKGQQETQGKKGLCTLGVHLHRAKLGLIVAEMALSNDSLKSSHLES